MSLILRWIKWIFKEEFEEKLVACSGSAVPWMWWRIRTEKGGRKRGKAVLLLSGQMDERQTDWIAGEREICKTLTGRNRWLNFKGGTENSQQRVLETAVMSSCQCQSMKYERDSCIYNCLMLQTKYSGEEEESKDEKKKLRRQVKISSPFKEEGKELWRETDGVWKFSRCETFALTLEACSAAPKHWCRIFAPAQLVSQAPSRHLIQVRDQYLVQGWILERIWSNFFGSF